ncbi:MAG: alpha/beta fold hydrolase [Anaerolineae bacterium]|nr:alpha/beta fold hydrolase [Anaerolineae bacterium]
MRRIAAALVLPGVLIAAAYGAVGTLVYDQGTFALPHCEQGPRPVWANNQPAAYVTGGAFGIQNVDITPYEMPIYETVTFSSRSDSITLQAWDVPAPLDVGDAAPAVILVHGLNDCRRAPAILLPAGMLHRAGFHVLLLDLRNHGDSQITTGRMSGGLFEYLDVLGAWDWLVNAQGIPPERIGLFGVSLGAATTLIAAGEEPRIAAVWEDSSYADVQLAIADQLTYRGIPTFLAPAGVLMGRLLDGVDLSARSPLAAIAIWGNRPLFITHGEADTRIPVLHAYRLAEAMRANGITIEPWIIPGSPHVQGMFDATDEYETRLVDFFRASLGTGTNP